MTVAFLILLLVVISVVAQLLIRSVLIFCRGFQHGMERPSEVVSIERTELDSDARPSEVVSPKNTSKLTDGVTNDNSAITFDAEIPEEKTARESEPRFSLPMSATEWSKYDEPTCRRKPGSFVHV